MGVPGAEALRQLLATNHNITKLMLRNAGVIPESVPALVAGLRQTTNLQVLDLSDNSLGFKEITMLSEALPSFSSLKRLFLADNYVGNSACLALAKGLKKLSTLVRLDLRNNHIGLKGMTLLSHAFPECYDLHYLWLDGNIFVENQKTVMDSVLREDRKRDEMVNRQLKNMDLYHRIICPTMKEIVGLRTLTISNCKAGDGLVTELAEALHDTQTLERLVLSNNVITSAGAVCLAQLLAINKTIILLDLSENMIDDVGGIALGEVIQSKNSTLYKLHLRVNQIGEAGGEALCNACTVSKMFHVSLEGNKLPFAIFSKLETLSNANFEYYKAAEAIRCMRKINKLRKQQDYLRKLEKEIEKHEELLKNTSVELEDAKIKEEIFYDTETKNTKQLDEDLKNYTAEGGKAVQESQLAESKLVSISKESDQKILNLRKNIDKEKRVSSGIHGTTQKAIETFNKNNEGDLAEEKGIKDELQKEKDGCEECLAQLKETETR